MTKSETAVKDETEAKDALIDIAKRLAVVIDDIRETANKAPKDDDVNWPKIEDAQAELEAICEEMDDFFEESEEDERDE